MSWGGGKPTNVGEDDIFAEERINIFPLLINE